MVIKETGHKGEREEYKGRGQGYLSQRDKGLPLDREETHIAHRQMSVCKGNGANLTLG